MQREQKTNNKIVPFVHLLNHYVAGVFIFYRSFHFGTEFRYLFFFLCYTFQRSINKMDTWSLETDFCLPIFDAYCQTHSILSFKKTAPNAQL